MIKRSLIAAVLIATTLAVQANDFQWTRESVFSSLPSETDGQWKRSPGGESAIVDNKLILDPGESAYAYWFYNGGDQEQDGWNGAAPTTVEFRMRVQDPATGAVILLLSDGQRSYQFTLRNGTWANYRIVLENGQADLYVEGNSDPVTKTRGYENHGENQGASPIGPNSIAFGKTRPNVKGASEWEYLRWINGEAARP